MTTKQTISVIVTLLLVAGSFTVGRFWTGYKTAMRDMMCIVYSDTEVREWLTNMHHIPEKSYKLYYGKYGFQDFQSFIAFSATREDCLQYLNNFINSNELQASTIVEDWVEEFSPRKHRPDLDHANWDLSPGKEYLKVKDTRGTIFLFDEDINRIYVCKPM